MIYDTARAGALRVHMNEQLQLIDSLKLQSIWRCGNSYHWVVRSYYAYFAPVIAAHRFFCAAAILRLAPALTFRFFLGSAVLGSTAAVSCFGGRSAPLRGPQEGFDGIWLVSFMDYDLGYIELEERTLQPLENPFGPKVLPMS